MFRVMGDNMRNRNLGKSGISASVVGLGTWAIGGWCWGGTDETAAIRGIQAAIDAGVNLIDTAPVYGFGVSELIVGKAIRGRRDKLVIATKCGLVWEHPEGPRGEHFFDSDPETFQTNAPDRKVHRYLGAKSVRREIEASLKRLGVDCIDLYQTHWQDSTTPIAETMATLLDLKKQGKIRSIGASNVTPAQLDEYAKHGQLDVVQDKYSMLDRQHEAALLPACAGRNAAFLAYSPLAMGILTGKVGPGREFPAGDIRHDSPRFTKANREKVAALLKEFEPIASARNITLAQLVLAWTLEQPGVTHALVGARDESQARANAAAGVVALTPTEITTICSALKRHADIA